VLKTDILLIESHRRECGAPDVADIDDIKLPANMPQVQAQAGMAFVKPLMGAMGVGGIRSYAVGPAAAGAVATPAPVPVGGISVVEIRLIALFVAKWKVDPVTAKAALTKLTAAQRRYVIQNFKATSQGAEALSELETYIKECEANKAWDTAAPAIKTVAPPTIAGLKRPLTPAAAVMNKMIRPAAKA